MVPRLERHSAGRKVTKHDSGHTGEFFGIGVLGESFRKVMIRPSDCDGFYNEGVYCEEDTKQHLSAAKGNFKGKHPLCIVLRCLMSLTRDQTKDEDQNGDAFQHVVCGD